MTTNDYKMTISWLTVDKLGIKLYDKVSAVIAELVSNSYDADATEVIIEAPLGRYLTTKADKGDDRKDDRKYEIKVIDNGMGMTPDEINDCYLRVGAERRIEEGSNRGDVSPKYRRRVMGCKGVGKLAPFGICEEIEILTSGGEADNEGKYLTAHLILNRADISSNDKNQKSYYQPKIGESDKTRREEPGTTHIIEIKKPDHKLTNQEMERVVKYYDTLDEFLKDPGNSEFGKMFKDLEITIVCDGINLSGSPKISFGYYKEKGLLKMTSWSAFFLWRTRRMHSDFLEEYERQKRRGVDQNE